MKNLFGSDTIENSVDDSLRPLADRLRPNKLEDIIGQKELIGDNKPLNNLLKSKPLPSIILWGPPGVGKTTIAKLLAKTADGDVIETSAVFTNTAELRKIFKTAHEHWKSGQSTTLFVDEIHRFNKTQQDGFLPYLEEGSIRLIGSTTENPSFELNPALLSRVRVLILQRLSFAELEEMIIRSEDYFGCPLPLTKNARDWLVESSDGDGRNLLNRIEQIMVHQSNKEMDVDSLHELFSSHRANAYDKSREWHYNLISALHKSVRGSDPDASLYWLARMLDAGEDPHYLARRITRMAIEDIGLADPDALSISLRAWQTYERLGSPEGELVLAEALIYLALAPKSNASYSAYKMALSDARKSGSLSPPKHILNAPTQLMKETGYGKGYQYDHDHPLGFSGQNYFPETMKPAHYYHPVERGFERTLTKRLQYFKNLRQKLSQHTK